MSVYKSDTLENIRCAVDSILSQTYSFVTLFIFKDGPVTESVHLYLEQLKSIKNVVLINSDKNIGLASALNVLIDNVLSSGEYKYIARMDSDDISRPTRIAQQVQFMENHPSVDVCGTSCHEFGASFAMDEKHLPVEHNQLLNFSVTRCPFIHPSVMFKSIVFSSGIRYPVSTSLTEDMALWFDLLDRGFIYFQY